jgi:hypothetical protein
MNNRAQILISAVDQTKSAFDSIKRGLGLMQQAKRAAKGFRTAAHFIAIAYLRLGKLTRLPSSPFVPAIALSAGGGSHRV